MQKVHILPHGLLSCGGLQGEALDRFETRLYSTITSPLHTDDISLGWFVEGERTTLRGLSGLPPAAFQMRETRRIQ